jgi:NAD(P)-dependent dehydrogenase (short-subunit alcohol dehydrogenase family)
MHAVIVSSHQLLLHASQHVVPHLKPGGSIINTISVEAYEGMPFMVPYRCVPGPCAWLLVEGGASVLQQPVYELRNYRPVLRMAATATAAAKPAFAVLLPIQILVIFHGAEANLLSVGIHPQLRLRPWQRTACPRARRWR